MLGTPLKMPAVPYEMLTPPPEMLLTHLMLLSLSSFLNENKVEFSTCGSCPPPPLELKNTCIFSKAWRSTYFGLRIDKDIFYFNNPNISSVNN